MTRDKAPLLEASHKALLLLSARKPLPLSTWEASLLHVALELLLRTPLKPRLRLLAIALLAILVALVTKLSRVGSEIRLYFIYIHKNMSKMSRRFQRKDYSEGKQLMII